MLVEEGILERREASEEKRTEYVLTEQGLALQPILLSMTHWGDRYRPNPKGTRVVFVDRQEGRPIQPMTVRSEGGRALNPEDVRATPGPAFDGPLKK
jgi:hypothetical protein